MCACLGLVNETGNLDLFFWLFVFPIKEERTFNFYASLSLFYFKKGSFS